jgi:hypothetical protein
MSLMTWVRSLVLLIVAWTLTALGIGALRGSLPSGDAPTYFVPQPADHDVLSARCPARQEHYLVDRTTGKTSSLRLPPGEEWSLFNVVPWRDSRGELEVVGRWVRRDPDVTWGWGLVRLSDGAVLDRIELDVPPISRPCWIPGRLHSILFALADGRLYWCDLAPRANSADAGASSRDDSAAWGQPRAVTWQAQPPGLGEAMLADPVWSSEPRLRKWVIVALSPKRRLAGKMVYPKPRLWWLEMSNQADAILAAGPLREAAGDDGPAAGEPAERLPSIARDARGMIRLVYLARRPAEGSWRLCSVGLAFDPETGRPRLQADTQTSLDQQAELATGPPVVSADGSRVFSLAGPGRIASDPLRSPTD